MLYNTQTNNLDLILFVKLVKKGLQKSLFVVEILIFLSF